MALDSITLYHLIKELRPLISGMRIDKIQQPEKEEVHLLLRGPGRGLRLLLNAGSTSPRIHLTDQNKKNPVSPPMFCMILRKHLEGGKIMDIHQVGLERVVTLTIQNYNERGDLQDYYLHLEIMGKHSNLILVDPATNTILDGIRRYSHLVSRYREVLPGRTYVFPPAQHKLDPVDTEEAFIQKILEYPLDQKISRALVDLFNGISPELSIEMVLRAGLDPEAVVDSCGEIDFSRLYQAYSLFLIEKDNMIPQPGIYYPWAATGIDRGIGNKPPCAFSLIPYLQYSSLVRLDTATLNQTVELFHRQKAAYHQNESQKGSLHKIVREHLSHLGRKLDIYQETLAKAQKNLASRKMGELLTANLYRWSPGLTEISVQDYTDPASKTVMIALDPNLSGIENAQRYYRTYNKAKLTVKKTEPLLASALEEMDYLKTIALSIDQAANDTELREIYQELVQQGYISGKQSKISGKKGSKNQAKNKGEEPHSRPHRYLSGTGQVIIVGRNNRQNDRMTWREAKPTDLWLHVKNIPGSHVIVPLPENEQFPDDRTLLDAATLAVYFSQARGSSHVPVDYTHVRQIKKPRGAKPGMVVYEQHWSLVITPEQETLERLLASEETTE